jgi:hypothetical protein
LGTSSEALLPSSSSKRGKWISPDDMAGMCIEMLRPSREPRTFLVAYLQRADELNKQIPHQAALFLDI